MNSTAIYEIRIQGLLTKNLADWFDTLQIEEEQHAQTLLISSQIDQAQLISLLIKLHSLNLPLLSVIRQNQEIS